MHFLTVSPEELRGQVVGGTDDRHFLSVVAKAHSGASPNIADFEVERVFWEEEDIRGFDVSMGYFWFLKVCEDFDHAGDEHDDVFLVEGLFPGREVGLEVGDSFFHLNVAFLAGVHVPSLFLDGVAAFVLYDVGMWIVFNFGEKFYFFPEDEFGLFVVETDFFDAFDVGLIVDDFVDDAIACADDLFEFEPFVEFPVSVQELHCFIVHRLYLYIELSSTSHQNPSITTKYSFTFFILSFLLFFQFSNPIFI